MKSLKTFYHVLSEYAQKQEAITAKSKEEYEKESEEINEKTKSELLCLRDLMPDLVQIGIDSSLTRTEAKTLVERIKVNAKSRSAIDILPTGDYFKDSIQNNSFFSPKYVNWQINNREGFNFVLDYRDRDIEKANMFMNNLILNMLIGLSAKSIKLSFVDLSLSGGYELFTKGLDESLCNSTVMGAREFDDLLSNLIERMRDALQNYGDVVKYNMKANSSKIPYEVVVLINYPKNYNSNLDDLASLFENGYKGGIYFVVMNNIDVEVDEHYKSLLALEKCYQRIEITDIVTSKGLVNATPISQNKLLVDVLLDYLNKEATHKEELPPIKADYHSLINKPFDVIDDELSVPVGETVDGQKILFRLSTVGHIHSFILGQSGSGKSVFLHNVISGAIAKYSPDDLHLYLMDFKLGGVEFNRYRDEKHVKALLVDNSDILITLEILRNINDQMRERGKLLRASGVSNIKDYNNINPAKRMPRILVVADECHVMFNPQGRKNLKQYSEISDIIVKIAKEGRSQGVHLIFATQTLAQTEISSEILNNVSDHYLLKCVAADSEKMVRDSSEITGNLTTGHVYYHGMDDEAQFQAYFVPMQEGMTLVDDIKKKASSYDTGQQFYFVGSQIFKIDEDVKSQLTSNSGSFPVAAVGRSIDINQSSVNIPLKDDDAENIMLFGIDDENQVTGTSLAILKSMIISTKERNPDCQYMIMDFLGNSSVTDVVKSMENECVKIVPKKEVGKTLYQICSDIEGHQVQPTALFILGQERFRDLKFDNDIEVTADDTNVESDDFGFGNAFADNSNGTNRYNTYRKALSYILDFGGEQGVHVIMQLDKPDRFLFDDYVTGKTVFSKFKHLIMLRSDENAVNRLNLNDDLALENLSSDPERLRAYYYNEATDTYVLFTPYR